MPDAALGPSRASTRTRRSRRTPFLSDPGIQIGTVPLAPPRAQHPPPQSPVPEEQNNVAPTSANAVPQSTRVSADSVELIVRETLRQLDVVGVERSGSSGANNRTPRRPPSHARTAVHQQQNKMSKRDNMGWKVNDALLSLEGRT